MGPQRPDGTNGEEQKLFRKKWDNAGTDHLAGEEKSTALEAVSKCELIQLCNVT